MLQVSCCWQGSEGQALPAEGGEVDQITSHCLTPAESYAANCTRACRNPEQAMKNGGDLRR